MRYVPFNRPYATGREHKLLEAAIARGHLSSGGPFTEDCTRRLQAVTSSPRAFLTHSCTGALEMAAILLDIGPGDEVIMPSYTFVSTANAFALRGAVPVFVDVREDTLNLDERLVEAAVTERTRAIVVVHYAGVACDMDAIGEIATRRGLAVIEDAAHSLKATYRGRTLGSIGTLGALSFHETKNVIAGEGGALLVNDPSLAGRAELLHEKGTNRSRFLRGEVDRYTWQDIGSSFAPSEIVAAFLLAQLEDADTIIAARCDIWEAYHAAFEPLEREGLVRRPVVPDHCRHDAHIYYLLLPETTQRREFMERLAADGIDTVFHYVPLHSAPAGRRLGRVSGELRVTDDAWCRLVRLPLWTGMAQADVEHVVDAVSRALLDSPLAPRAVS